MTNDDLSSFAIKPLETGEMAEAEQLFYNYPYKDFQLRQLAIPKDKMASFLRRSLTGEGVLTVGLREDGKLVGMISAKQLPWMSQLFGANMYSVQHFVTAGKEPGHYQTMLRYMMDQIPGIDFLDCRVSSGDVNAIQALENAGFRFVGNEVYLVRSLLDQPVPDEYGQAGCVPCPDEHREKVMDLVRETHFHNRYMYDPEISRQDASEIYAKYLAGFAFKPDYRSLIKVDGKVVKGFIFYKYNTALSSLVGGKYASLDFIGVNQEVQNHGMGEALNQAALFDLSQAGATHVVVRTFGSNYPAIRICQKVGFKITSSDLHFHNWLRPRAKIRQGLHSNGQPFVDACAAG